MNHPPEHDDIYQHATRLWLEKAIIGLNLCPFAKAPYSKNKVRLTVIHSRHLDDFLQTLDNELQLLAETPIDEIETTLLIEPKLFPDFEIFNEMLVLADEAIDDNHLNGVIQIAPFHPQFQFENTQNDDISNYTNRSPYPTLHLIREESIDKAVAAIADPADIYQRNIALLQAMGQQGWLNLGIPMPGNPIKPNTK
ncbi:DUF1415 domain-containing protein [Stenoxybacter acetivorans]|uniref:DUF1415 domain-containing protein n=1 Tax=Stenoxybacter acetivorans TaxID=422441 RepID=UPI00056A0597|nr:DUF1415 domain-containing protein [Stenoxybacter acetivorans]